MADPTNCDRGATDGGATRAALRSRGAWAASCGRCRRLAPGASCPRSGSRPEGGGSLALSTAGGWPGCVGGEGGARGGWARTGWVGGGWGKVGGKGGGGGRCGEVSTRDASDGAVSTSRTPNGGSPNRSTTVFTMLACERQVGSMDWPTWPPKRTSGRRDPPMTVNP